MKHNQFFILFSIIFGAAVAEKCQPGIVTGVNFTTDYQLTWPAASNPNNCTITSYVIYLTNLDDNTVQLYETSNASQNNTYDFNNLEMCTRYSFGVVAKTNEDVIGQDVSVTFTTSPKEGVDLNVTITNTEAFQNSIFLEWQMDQSNATKCISYYRVVHWDKDNHPVDIYTTDTTFNLTNLIPCMQYEFEIVAILINPEIEGPSSLAKIEAIGKPMSPPHLQNMTTTANKLYTEWLLESYTENMCSDVRIVVTILPGNLIANIPIQDDPIDPERRLSWSLTGLRGNTVYTGYFYAANSAGNSSVVTVMFQTQDDGSGNLPSSTTDSILTTTSESTWEPPYSTTMVEEELII